MRLGSCAVVLRALFEPILGDRLVESAFQAGVRALASKPCFKELLAGALGVAEVADGILILPALFPRLAQTTSAGFARLDPALRQFRFHQSGIFTRTNSFGWILSSAACTSGTCFFNIGQWFVDKSRTAIFRPLRLC